MADMSPLPNLSRCRTISGVPLAMRASWHSGRAEDIRAAHLGVGN